MTLDQFLVELMRSIPPEKLAELTIGALREVADAMGTCPHCGGRVPAPWDADGSTD